MKKNLLKKLVSIGLCTILAVSGCVYAGAVTPPENMDEIVETESDRTDINNCYSYVCYLLNKFGDVLTQADYDFMNNIRFVIQENFLYPQDEENSSKSVSEIKQKLLDYKLTTQNSDIYSFENFLKIIELAQTMLDSNKFDEYIITYVGIPVFKNFNGYFLISARYNLEEPMPASERYGDYILENEGRSIPSIFGYLAVNPETGDVITLENGLKNGVIDTDKLFEISIGFDMYKLGDADNDGELTIKDATVVQKAGVDLAEIVKTRYGMDTVFDYNNDGRVSILDVTCIQKKLVSLD
ncbi:hypothetical protein [Ruminococcus sp.]|uniref:hypothetical protein n=1 Tax=Ruminococcus sp. TaxID=41978 RepID=UPI003EFE18AC